jgi:hypothetical protein
MCVGNLSLVRKTILDALWDQSLMNWWWVMLCKKNEQSQFLAADYKVEYDPE